MTQDNAQKKKSKVVGLHGPACKYYLHVIPCGHTGDLHVFLFRYMHGIMEMGRMDRLADIGHVFVEGLEWQDGNAGRDDYPTPQEMLKDCCFSHNGVTGCYNVPKEYLEQAQEITVGEYRKMATQTVYDAIAGLRDFAHGHDLGNIDG
jgi:hypothetical protein